MEKITTQDVMFIIGILGTIFTVYNYFKKPQDELDKKVALGNERDKNKATVLSQKDIEKDTALLEQKFDLERKSNDDKFAALTQSLKESTSLAQNHIHTIDTKVDNLSTKFNQLENSITRLGTIIEERIPKK